MPLQGKWYLIALNIVACIITVSVEHYIVLILFFGWLMIMFGYRRISFLFLIFSVLVSFLTFHHLPDLSVSFPDGEEQMVLKGEISSVITETDKKMEFTLQNEDGKRWLIVYFKNDSTPVKVDSFRYGAYCILTGERSSPMPATNPYQFDYRDYLAKQGIYSQFIVTSLNETNCTSGSFLSYIYDARAFLLKVTEQHLQEGTTKWVHALVLGDDSLLDQDVIKLFQRWGLSHILAISGLHIGIVVGLIYIVLNRFSLLTKEKAQLILLFFLPCYAILAGGQPSVWRASLMVVTVILIRYSKWKVSYTDLISYVFIALIVFDPYIVFHVGFQLSFAVTFGIILSRKWLSESKYSMESLFKLSFVAQMVILPLQLHYFSIFEPSSILMNMIIVPYFSLFVIPILFLFLLILFLPIPIIRTIEYGFHLIHDQILAFIWWMDAHFHFPFIIGEISLYEVLVYYVIFILLMIALEEKKQWASLQYGILLCIYIIFLAIRPYFSPYGTVTMLDIGQGDAFIIELPYRKGVFLVDAGAQMNFSEQGATDKEYNQIIQPYLYGRGISKIDAIFLSHEDGDHDGSVEYLIKDIQVDTLVISPFYVMSKIKEQQWAEANIAVLRMTFNKSITIRGQVFHILAPKQATASANDNSLVLYTEIGGLSWIFTGDIGEEIERIILTDYPTLTFDVLKVAHHGSNTSSSTEFVQKANTFAFISVGRKNAYGHPAQEVVKTLEAQQLTIYRTDIHGAVQYRFKGEEGFFIPFLKESLK